MTQREEPWTVRRVLEWTAQFFTRKQVDSPRLAAELLLAHVMGVPRIKLYTDYERALAGEQLAAFRALVQRAADHEPIAYLTGRAHFFNLELEVNRDVLIPRPDSEMLVESVLQLARNQAGFQAPRVLDLCTGSGCVALAIASHLKSATVVATDRSAAAVALARRNAERLGLSARVSVQQGDLYDALAKNLDVQPFNIITANPPYIRSAQIPQLDRNVREYEPREALDGGADGLEVFRRILQGAPARLPGGGRIYVEIAYDQGELARQIASAQSDFEDVRILKDYGGRDRALTARRR